MYTHLLIHLWLIKDNVNSTDYNVLHERMINEYLERMWKEAIVA
jgi:hypothetical protein